MNVIILAAGEGKRMKALTKKKPKCFLEINGISLIQRLINQLLKLGLKDISIVTGYKAKQFNFKKINSKEYLPYEIGKITINSKRVNLLNSLKW